MITFMADNDCRYDFTSLDMIEQILYYIGTCGLTNVEDLALL